MDQSFTAYICLIFSLYTLITPDHWRSSGEILRAVLDLCPRCCIMCPFISSYDLRTLVWVCEDACQQCNVKGVSSLIPRLLWGREKKRAWYALFAHAQFLQEFCGFGKSRILRYNIIPSTIILSSVTQCPCSMKPCLWSWSQSSCRLFAMFMTQLLI